MEAYNIQQDLCKDLEVMKDEISNSSDDDLVCKMLSHHLERVKVSVPPGGGRSSSRRGRKREREEDLEDARGGKRTIKTEQDLYTI